MNSLRPLRNFLQCHIIRIHHFYQLDIPREISLMHTHRALPPPPSFSFILILPHLPLNWYLNESLLTSLKLIIISRESSMSLNIPSSLLVKFAPHSEGERERRRREGGREGERERECVCVCVCQGSPMLSASFSVSCLARSKVETHPQSYRKLSRVKGQTVQICKTKLDMGPTSQTMTLIPSAKDKSDQTRGERERRK